MMMTLKLSTSNLHDVATSLAHATDDVQSIFFNRFARELQGDCRSIASSRHQALSIRDELKTIAWHLADTLTSLVLPEVTRSTSAAR